MEKGRRHLYKSGTSENSRATGDPRECFVIVCQAQGEDPWDRGRESPGARPAEVTQEDEEAEMVKKGGSAIWGT